MKKVSHGFLVLSFLALVLAADITLLKVLTNADLGSLPGSRLTSKTLMAL